jgi:hypothetical protein
VKPQTARVLEVLRERGSFGLTPLDALGSCNTLRLGARIWELKAEGFDVRSEMWRTPSGKRVSRYTLHETAQLTLGVA